MVVYGGANATRRLHSTVQSSMFHGRLQDPVLQVQRLKTHWQVALGDEMDYINCRWLSHIDMVYADCSFWEYASSSNIFNGGSIRHPPISQSQAVQRRLEPRPSSLQLAGTPPSLWNSATSGVGAEGAALPGGDGGSDEGWEMMAIWQLIEWDRRPEDDG